MLFFLVFQPQESVSWVTHELLLKKRYVTPTLSKTSIGKQTISKNEMPLCINPGGLGRVCVCAPVVGFPADTNRNILCYDTKNVDNFLAFFLIIILYIYIYIFLPVLTGSQHTLGPFFFPNLFIPGQRAQPPSMCPSDCSQKGMAISASQYNASLVPSEAAMQNGNGNPGTCLRGWRFGGRRREKQ